MSVLRSKLQKLFSFWSLLLFPGIVHLTGLLVRFAPGAGRAAGGAIAAAALALAFIIDGFVQRQPKGQRHQRKQRPIEKIHPKIPFC